MRANNEKLLKREAIQMVGGFLFRRQAINEQKNNINRLENELATAKMRLNQAIKTDDELLEDFLDLVSMTGFKTAVTTRHTTEELCRNLEIAPTGERGAGSRDQAVISFIDKLRKELKKRAESNG